MDVAWDIRLDTKWSRELRETFESVMPPAQAQRNSAVVNLEFKTLAKHSDSPQRSPCNLKSGYSLRKLVASSTPELSWTESRVMLEEALQYHSSECVSDDKLIASGESILRKRLSELGLDLQVQQGDGNCLFRSISVQLFGTPENHVAVRAKVVEYMMADRAQFEPFLGEDFSKYISAMARPGTWGDELSLRAACESFQIMISVITSERSNWFVRYTPKISPRGDIFLAYVSPIHYNAIVRRKNFFKSRH